MNVRLQKTARGEIAILPRMEYEALAAKAAEAEEDAGTARIARGRAGRSPPALLCCRSRWSTASPKERTPCESCANGAM